MENFRHGENQQKARVVEERAGVGTTEIVSGWQAILVDLLSRMKPFPIPDMIIHDSLTGKEDNGGCHDIH